MKHSKFADIKMQTSLLTRVGWKVHRLTSYLLLMTFFDQWDPSSAIWWKKFVDHKRDYIEKEISIGPILWEYLGPTLVNLSWLCVKGGCISFRRPWICIYIWARLYGKTGCCQCSNSSLSTPMILSKERISADTTWHLCYHKSCQNEV